MYHVILLVWPILGSCVFARVDPEVEVGVAHTLYHGVGVQDFDSLMFIVRCMGNFRGRSFFRFQDRMFVRFCAPRCLFIVFNMVLGSVALSGSVSALQLFVGAPYIYYNI